MAKMPLEHALTRSTVRLLTGPTGGPPTSTGTGFFYQVTIPSTDKSKAVIVTNKHVVEGAETVTFILSIAESLTDLNEHHQPVGRTDEQVTMALAGMTYHHPDPEVDLCAIDITLMTAFVLQHSGKKLRSMFLDSNWLRQSESERNSLLDIEQVLVVGYPKGLWDEHNNMPIARLGTTATHPLGHYQGKKDFLIDIAAYSGSSGSPVFTYEAPFYRDAEGAYSPGTKATLIGIVWGVIESTSFGEMKVVNIPSKMSEVPVLRTSLNLALALHADALLELDEVIRAGGKGDQPLS